MLPGGSHLEEHYFRIFHLTLRLTALAIQANLMYHCAVGAKWTAQQMIEIDWLALTVCSHTLYTDVNFPSHSD
jgi:hypothetical protein